MSPHGKQTYTAMNELRRHLIVMTIKGLRDRPNFPLVSVAHCVAFCTWSAVFKLATLRLACACSSPDTVIQALGLYEGFREASCDKDFAVAPKVRSIKGTRVAVNSNFKELSFGACNLNERVYFVQEANLKEPPATPPRQRPLTSCSLATLQRQMSKWGGLSGTFCCTFRISGHVQPASGDSA